MFYRQDKIDYIDKEKEEFIISFRDCDLLFKISGYKKGLNITYDGTDLVYENHVEEVRFKGKFREDGKHENKGIIKSPFDFVKGNLLTFRELQFILLKTNDIYVTIYGGTSSEFFDAEVEIRFKENTNVC